MRQTFFIAKDDVYVSAIAGVLLKPQDFHFFVQYNSCRDTENSDILFGSEYKSEI